MSDNSEVICSCGSRMFWESTRCNGWWECLIDSTGSVEETNLDKVKYGPNPKTVKCAECGKRNPNPRMKKPSN